MTGTSPGSDPTVDRRWFEEALRAQGFVVEPPDLDHEPEGDGQPADSTPSDAGAADPATATRERPPVPSALLARIAVRGPAPTTPVEAPTSAAAPWADAVVATVAPWSATDVPETVALTEPTQVEAETVPAAAVEASDAAAPAADPETATLDPAITVEPAITAEPAAEALVGSPVVLDSPYIGPQAGLEPTPQPTAPLTTSTTTDVSEGELWALVGGSAAPAARAPGSQAVRLTLTILVALVILVIVVGGLVVASQLV